MPRGIHQTDVTRKGFGRVRRDSSSLNLGDIEDEEGCRENEELNKGTHLDAIDWRSIPLHPMVCEAIHEDKSRGRALYGNEDYTGIASRSAMSAYGCCTRCTPLQPKCSNNEALCELADHCKVSNTSRMHTGLRCTAERPRYNCRLPPVVLKILFKRPNGSERHPCIDSNLYLVRKTDADYAASLCNAMVIRPRE